MRASIRLEDLTGIRKRTDVPRVIESLLAKSLISMTELHRSPYYRLLETTRAFAQAKLAERDERNRVARRHAKFFSIFSNTTGSFNRGSASTIRPDTPRISGTCARRSGGHSLMTGMSRWVLSLPPGRRRYSSDCRCSRSVAGGVNWRLTALTPLPTAPDRR
jgi:hypothetical protein